MPIIKSAKKRVRIAEKAAIRNSKVKRSLKTALKAFRASFTADDQAKAQSNIDTAVKKGLIHKNKAARLKAQLATAAKENGGKAPKPSASTKAAGAKKSTGAKKVQTPVKAAAKKTTAAKKASTAKVAPAKAAAKKTSAKK